MSYEGLISVIIPVYNMEKYLIRCVDSVRFNTYKKLEIICVNDGSKDNSLNILKDYAEIDERIIVVNQENQKLSAARNAGINLAKGEWIAFIDSDDWIHPQYFEALVSVGEKEHSDIVICDTSIVSEFKTDYEKLDINSICYKNISKAELGKMHIARTRVWGRLYRREVIGDLRFISGVEPVEDNCFNTMLYSSKMKFSFLDAKLYYYFMRSDSAVHQNTGRQSLVYLKYMLPVLEKEKDSEKKRDMIVRCYNILLSSRYLEMYSNDFPAINTIINKYKSILDKNRKYLPFKEQAIYCVLGNSPKLYRAWRIHDDPTLLEHENNLKKHAEEEKLRNHKNE